MVVVSVPLPVTHMCPVLPLRLRLAVSWTASWLRFGCVPAAKARLRSELRLRPASPIALLPGIMPSWLRVALRPGAASPQNPAIAIAFRQPLSRRMVSRAPVAKD
eukprot:7199922-Alexandrium_andersonii.AAC.1